jgi:hypothetical protein
MEPRKQYIIDSLQKQSDLITGFIVLQSLALSYQLGNPNFLCKVKENTEMLIITLILHACIIAGATVILLLEGRKITKHMDDDLSKILRPMSGAYIRCFLILSFGLFPLMILLKIFTTS